MPQSCRELGRLLQSLTMPTRARIRQTNHRRRGTPVVRKSHPGTRVVARTEHSSAKTAPSAPAHAAGQMTYAKALRYLATLSDFERLRIVRYNSANFNLARMRA